VRNKLIFILSAASLFVAGSALGATKHHHRGYHAYAAGQGYRSTCAQQNAKWNSEPGSIAIQDKDQAKAVGGRRATCY
jgi:hypothetical protein